MTGDEPLRVLVVDDEPFNRLALAGLLKEECIVVMAKDGPQTLERAASDPQPDLILLDVVMPEMDGYEVLARLRDNPRTAHILVMFVTGLTSEWDEQRGLELGAVDYVHKPFRPAIVGARVRNYLYYARQRKILEQAMARLQGTLEQLNRAQAQMIQQEKLASLGLLVAGVAHELNTPVGNAIGMVSQIEREMQETSEALTAEHLSRTTLQDVLNSTIACTNIAMRSLTRAANLIQSFKQVAADRSSEDRRQFEVNEYIGEVVEAMRPALTERGMVCVVAIPPDAVMDSYPGPLSQVLINLIGNTMQHAYLPGSPGVVRILGRQDSPDWLRIEVVDDGVGIPTDVQPRIFDPFFTTRRGGDSGGYTGLGLHIVHNIVVGALGGRIEVMSDVGVGTTFTLILPTVAPRT